MKRIAFVGNPNVGKSAWINALSNASFKVGNWAGVTIEKKYADVIWNEQAYQLIDLPGTYALVDTNNEEAITTQYLANEQVDMIVNVVDATNLSRNLFLTLSLRRLQKPMFVLLNFMDEVNKYKIQIDIKGLSNALGLSVYAYSAYDKKGVEQIKRYLQMPIVFTAYSPILPSNELESYDVYYHTMKKQIPSYILLDDCAMEWLLYDGFVHKDYTIKQFKSWHMNVLEDIDREDLMKYACIKDLLQFVKEGKDRLQFTKRIDAYLLHPFVGFVFLIFVCISMMLFVFQGSAPFNNFIEFFIQDMVVKYMYAALSFLPESALHLIVQGVIGGVGGVLVFIPLMAFLTFTMSLLEESGYMARIAFLLDRFMQNFHLNGKSFVSLLLGFGCNVPAIYATRTLDNEKQKRLTGMLVPFMSCGARLPVYMLFAAAFFKEKAVIAVLSMYGIGILIALILALVLTRNKAFHDDQVLLMELPPYRKPAYRVVFKKVKQEVQGYIRKALRVVLWAMIILWSLSYFPSGKVETSYIAQFGKMVAPIYEPLGFGTRWESVSALPGSIIAKETVVGFFNQVLLEEEESIPDAIHPYQDCRLIASHAMEALQGFVISFIPTMRLPQSDTTLITSLSTLWQDDLANLRAYCYMVYILLSIPCVMTLYALKREYGIKYMFLSIGSMLLIPYLVSFSIFQIISLL